MEGGATGGMASVIVVAHAGWEEYLRYAKRPGPSSVKQVVMYLGALFDVAGVDHLHYWNWHRWEQAMFVNGQCQKNNQIVVKRTCGR